MTCRSLCFSPFPKRFPDFHSWSQSWPPIARGLVLLLLVAPLRCGRCHVEFAAAAEARNLTGTVVAQCWTVVKRNVSTCSTKSDVEWLSHHLLRKKIIIKCILQLHATQNRRNKMWQNGWYNIEKWWKMIKHIHHKHFVQGPEMWASWSSDTAATSAASSRGASSTACDAGCSSSSSKSSVAGAPQRSTNL